MATKKILDIWEKNNDSYILRTEDISAVYHFSFGEPYTLKISCRNKHNGKRAIFFNLSYKDTNQPVIWEGDSSLLDRNKTTLLTSPGLTSTARQELSFLINNFYMEKSSLSQDFSGVI